MPTMSHTIIAQLASEVPLRKNLFFPDIFFVTLEFTKILI